MPYDGRAGEPKEGNNRPPFDPGTFVPPLPDARKGPYPKPQRMRGVPSASTGKSGAPKPAKRNKPRSAADEQMQAGMGKVAGAAGGGGAGKNAKGDGCLTVFVLNMVITAAGLTAIGTGVTAIARALF